MATRTTTNLKLRISDDLTDDAIYNLERLDTNAGAVTVDSFGNLEVYSAEDILILPNAPDKDGTGVGGTVKVGTASQDIDKLELFGALELNGDLRLEDIDAPGVNYLTMKYSGGGLDSSLTLTLTADTIATLPEGSITLADTTTTQTLDSKTFTNANIDATPGTNNITGITDASVSAVAGIQGTKINPDFGSQNITTSGELRLEAGTSWAGFKGNPSLVTPSIWTLPASDGALNQVLVTDGAYGLGWATVVTDSLNENNIRIGNATNTSSDTDTGVLGDILANSTTGLTIKNSSVTNAHVSPSAAIDTSKLEALTANRVPVLDSSGFISASTITNVELGYLSGITGNVQSALDSKANTSDIGSTIQAWDSDLDTLASLTGTTNHVIIGASGTWTQSAFTSISGAQQGNFTWVNADGASKVITHSFTNQRVLVQIWDENDEQIWIDSVDQTDANTVTLIASAAPTTSWTVTIKEVV